VSLAVVAVQNDAITVILLPDIERGMMVKTRK
jgi:hypothetical protein